MCVEEYSKMTFLSSSAGHGWPQVALLCWREQEWLSVSGTAHTGCAWPGWVGMKWSYLHHSS